MTTQRYTSKRSYCWHLLRCLAFLCVLTLSVGLVQPAQAATPSYVVGWGDNDHGAINVPAGLSGVTAIATGGGHSLAVKSDGTVVAWGSNDDGQLNIPTGLNHVIAVAAGYNHSLALKSDGTVVAWGSNDIGQLNIPTGLSGVTAIAASTYHSLALKNDGTVVAWGFDMFGQLNIPAGLSGVIAIAPGSAHGLALKNDGTVVAWGCSSYGEYFVNFGQCTVPAGLTNVTAIAAGDAHSLALKSDGTVVAWGWNIAGQLNIPGGLSGVVAIAAGRYHSLALKNDGTIVAWGNNDYAQLNIPAGLRGVTAIAAGGDSNLALTTLSDFTLPTARPSQLPATNAAGWNNSDVTVNWGWRDFESGIDPAHCPSSSTSSGEGTLTLASTCQDIAGNVGSAEYTVQVDKTAPTLSVTDKPSNLSNVAIPSFTFSAMDNSGGSGMAFVNCIVDDHVTENCTSPFNTGPLADGVHRIILAAGDLAGNTTPFVYAWTIDTTAPTVTVNQAAGQADPTTSNPVLFTASFSKPAFGFTESDVTLGGTADLSGATVTVSGGNINYTIRVDGVAGNGTVTAVVTAGVATDNIGNGNAASTSTDNMVTVNFDTTSPVITPNVVGTLGNNGWYKSDVNVTWSVVDNESTISNQSGCEAQSINTDTAGVTITCTANSAGGSSSQSVTIKRDATAPAITFVNRTAANGNGWNNTDVAVNWSCSDATSDVVAVSVNQTVNGEGANQSITGTCTDKAGNSATNTQSGINIDKTPPTISAAATTQPNANDWYNSDVTIHFTCTDALSKLAANACPADQVLSSEGKAIASTAQTITDLAGNSSAASNVVTVKIDKTTPTISAAATTNPNANGWYNSDVTIHFTCADNLSEVTSCPADETLSSEGSAVDSTAPTISDGAGNQSAVSNVVTVQIDKTAPVVTVTGVSNNASYTLGSVPTAGCSTVDALSDVATQATLSVTGGNADGTGSFTATCSGASDNAGNNGSASVTYSVAYTWTGFFQPVDNLPVVNTVNAGQAIPVKFSLGGDYGLNIFASGYPASQNVSCGGNGGGSTSPIEETVTAGNSSLQYEPGTQRYIYVWKTDKAWAGTCRQLIVKLIDGTDHIALFQFNGKGRSADAGESDEGEADPAAEAVVGEAQRIFLPLVNR